MGSSFQGAYAIPANTLARSYQGGVTAPALALANTIVGLAIAALMIAMPIAAHGVHAALGITLALTLTVVCAWHAPQVAVIAVLFAFLFQNLFVSLMADLIRNEDDFDIVRAYNFLILAATWTVAAIRFLARWHRHDPELISYVKITSALMAVIGIYFLVGFAFNGITAVIYLRNIVTPLLFFQLCVILLATYPARLGPSLSFLGLLIIVGGFFEFANREAWFSWTNSHGYWSLGAEQNWQTLVYDKKAAETGEVIVNFSDTFAVDFFNTPLLSDLGIEMQRLFGPNMHSISFAYALAFFLIFALFRGRWVQATLLTILLFLCNAKGPIILLLMACGGWSVFRLFGAGMAFAAVISAAFLYALAGIAIGLNIGDFHVLGLMSAIHEFLLNPIGRGIGSGGNLSPMFTTINWHDAQAQGRTPFPVESSVGVLLYQLGVFALAIVGCYLWIAWRVMRVARVTGNDLHAATSLGLVAFVANGLFQEEAYFSPLGLALVLGLAGMILGAAIRNGVGHEAQRGAANS